MSSDLALFPYQEFGAAWLASRRQALLADEMGLGKSAQAIRAADRLGSARILIICPAVARVNWLREFEKFSVHDRQWTVIEKGTAKFKDTDSLICSYDMAEQLSAFGPALGAFDVLILDEAHYLKSVSALRTAAVWGREGLVRRAGRVWALTGTPAPNHVGEMWTLLYTFGATPLKYEAFVARYCTMGFAPHPNRPPPITGTNMKLLPEIRAMIAQVTLRREKDQVMKELPPIFYTDVVVEAGPVNIDVEQSFVQYVFPVDRTEELKKTLIDQEELLRMNLSTVGYESRAAMQTLAALAESISTLRRYTGLQKVAACAELVKSELSADPTMKIVIFAIHRDVIEGLRVKLKDFGAVTLYGGTAPAKKQQNIDKFQTNPACRVFIGNIQACGTAVTLTAAHHVLFVEQDWVPGNNAQAAMRCHRIGQTKPVSVRFAGLANTIDARVSQVLKRKSRQLSAIFNDGGLQKAKCDDSPSIQPNDGDVTDV